MPPRPRATPPAPASPAPARAASWRAGPPAWAAALAAGLLHLALCALAFEPGPAPSGDNGTYVALARSLLERGAYLESWDPAQPAHTQYPPAFPLMLAGGLTAGLSLWVGIKWLCVALSAAAAGASALWLRRVLTPWAALVAALLVAAVPGPLSIANQVLSDVPFWTWTALALWAYARAGDVPEQAAGWRWEALGAAAVVLAYFTRIAGLPLAIAAGAWLLLHRRWRGLGILSGSLLPLALAWALRNRSVGGTSAYQREFWWINPYVPSRGTIGPAEFAERILANLKRYGTDRLPALYFGDEAMLAPWAVAAVALLVGFAVAGWGLRLRRPTVAELFVPLYVGLLLIWPATWSGERFILPILPLLIGYAGVALFALGARLPRPALLPAVAAAALAIMMVQPLRYRFALGAACRAGFAAGDPAPCLPPVWADLLRGAVVVRGRLPEGSVVIHRKPTLFYVDSGYRSLLYPKSMDPDTFLAAVRRSGADYAVVDQIADMSGYLHRVMTRRPHWFCVVGEYSYPNAVLTRVVPGAPPMPPGSPPSQFRTCPASGPPFPGLRMTGDTAPRALFPEGG